MTGRGQEVVSASLFEYVTDYAAAVASGAGELDRIHGTHALVVFTENFVVQFSMNFLGTRIAGFSDRSAREMRQERRRLESGENHLAAQSLMLSLESLFHVLPEFSYGNSSDDAEAFHNEYFPDLLRDIVAWLAEFEPDGGSLTAARESLDAYCDALGM